jgi:hypothetical protein
VRASFAARSLALAGALVLAGPLGRAEAAKIIQLDAVDCDAVLDVEVLRRTLETDVGVAVKVSKEGTSPGIVVRRRDDGTVGILVRTGHAGGAERTISLPKDRSLAAEIAALAASNLLRDEAGEILAALAPIEPARPPEPPAPPARDTSPSSALPPPRPMSPCLDSTTVPTVPIGADFAPFVGSSSVQPNRVRWVSLNLLGGYARGLRALEMAAGVNVEAEFMCGVQFAGLANIVLGPARGAQFGPVAVVSGDVQGLQAGVGNLAGDSLAGAQVGSFNITAGAVSGAQIGAFNIGLSSVRGAQIGAVNVAVGDAQGVQIGAINYADRATAPIGAVSIVRHGRTNLEASATESGLTTASVRHGGTIVHNLYGVGYRLGKEAWWSLELGIGVHVPLAARLAMDIDLVYHALQKGRPFSSETYLTTLQPTLAYTVSEPFSLFAAPTFNVLVSNEGESTIEPPWGSFRLDSSGPQVVHGWPGFTLGVRAEL